MRKKLIINADDFGLTMGVSHGIIEAHVNGIVTSTTALVVSPYFEKSMELSKRFPSLKIGVHMTLTANGLKPVLGDKVPSLVNDEGHFKNAKEILNTYCIDEVEREWTAQIEKFLSCGFEPTHIDSHHNIHGSCVELFQIAKKLSQKYHLPIRNPIRSTGNEYLLDNMKGLNTPHKMFAKFYNSTTNLNAFKEILMSIIQDPQAEIFEMNCHPAFMDKPLKILSSYYENRVVELELLTSAEFKSALTDNQIDLIDYTYLKTKV